MALDPHPVDDGEWIDLSTPEGNARWDQLIAADPREPMPLSAYADHRAKRGQSLSAPAAEQE